MISVEPENWNPGPLHIKGPKSRPRSPIDRETQQKLLEGPRIWPRTTLCPTYRKTPEEKDRFSTGAAQGKRLPAPYCGAHYLTNPYSYHAIQVFPNHSDVRVDKTSNHLK